MSSATAEWATPKWLFSFIQGSTPFDLDVCATVENAKCSVFYTKEDDCFTKPWFGRWFCNPVYGRGIMPYIEYGIAQVKQQPPGSTGTYLVPARVDTQWFKKLWRQASVVLFLEGRVSFGDESCPAPFPSAIIEISAVPPSRPLVDIVDAAGLCGRRR